MTEQMDTDSAQMQVLSMCGRLTHPLTDEGLAARLDDVTTLIEQAELYRAQLVDRARRQELSWTVIGQNTGMTKQAAQQRWGRKPSSRVDAGTSPLF